MKKILKNMEFKTEDIDESKKDNTVRIVGLSAGFNNLDSYRDVIEKGSFLKTIEKNPNWPVLRNHDSDRKIGFSSEPVETAKGLKTTSIISLDTQDGREQAALSKLAFSIEKAKDAQSIGFSIPEGGSRVEESKKFGGKVQFLSEIEMWEHSFVTWGANERAESTGLKSFLGKESEGFGLGDYVDQFFRFMEGLKYDSKEVRDIMLSEEREKQAGDDILALMNNTINLLKS